jgi:hypothetical protein
MILTTYICDRCGKQSSNKNIKLENVGIRVGQYDGNKLYTDGVKMEITKQWCEVCRIETGMIARPDGSAVEAKELTAEQLVQEIIASLFFI